MVGHWSVATASFMKKRWYSTRDQCVSDSPFCFPSELGNDSGHAAACRTGFQYDDSFLTSLRQPDACHSLSINGSLAVGGNDSRIKSDSWNAFFSTGVPDVPAHSSSKRRAPQLKAEEEGELPTTRASLMWTYRSLLKSRGQQTYSYSPD